MKISFNPSNSNKNILDLIKNNKDIIFDLKGHSIFARGVEFKGTDTNTWRDIKINNVSIGSHTLDLRNGSNTTLTNTNGVVTINSTWRPVVDNLTSDSTTSSLSAKQGKVLKALIDGKSNSDHNHDGRYVRYYAGTTLDCNRLAAGLTAVRISATNAAHANPSVYLQISDVGTPFQIQIPDSSIPYIYKRYYGSGKWSGWFKLNAGYADSAGSVAWANVTGKPSSYTPSAHTHAWNSLTHSSTTENQAILTNGKANGWKLQTLNIARWDNAANNAHSHANKSVLDGITSALVNSWNTAYNFAKNSGINGSTITLNGTSINVSSIINNYYWANVKISTSSSTTTSPTVSNLTATSSIRMGNISLEHTNEINNITNDDIHLNLRNSGNISLCYGGGNVRIGDTPPLASYKLDVDGQMRAKGFHHASVNSNNYMLLAGGEYKSLGGSDTSPIFIGCTYLYRGDDGTVNSFFNCLGYTVPFTYTRGGNYSKIVIPDTTNLIFYIRAATASVCYSGQGMDYWTGYRRGAGAWWLHCYAIGFNEVRVKGFCLADKDKDSWWGGNPLWNNNYGVGQIIVCIFGHVAYR